jgi:hypothetical protein
MNDRSSNMPRLETFPAVESWKRRADKQTFLLAARPDP